MLALEGKISGKQFSIRNEKSSTNIRRKRQGFDGKKPNWNALWRNISRDITGQKQTRLRSEKQWKFWKLLFYLDFPSYFEATSPNCFNVFCKILLQWTNCCWRGNRGSETEISSCEIYSHGHAPGGLLHNRRKERVFLWKGIRKISFLTIPPHSQLIHNYDAEVYASIKASF